MIGYNISLAVSVNKLTKDKIQTVRVIAFKLVLVSGLFHSQCQSDRLLLL